MKSWMKRVMLGICALVMVGSLAACFAPGAGAEVGKYAFDSLEVGGAKIADDQISALGAEEVTTYYIELQDGGKAKVYFASQGEFEGTYTVSGDKVNITIDGEAESFGLKDGILSVEMDGTKVNFKK